MTPWEIEVRNSEKEVKELILALTESTNLTKSGKCTKYSNHINGSAKVVDSWKFNEWDYGKEPKIILPIKARGLFTTNDKILARGYDKFFNVNEVVDTKLENLKSKTTGPYDVTVKENGCIILIGGLESGEVVVCSKHSTGVRDDLTRNHALRGEMHLKQQIATGNKSLNDFGKLLYKLNVTAVAELCDDEFEEHVLPYPKERSGLYLHGLNLNTIRFQTYPMDIVKQFAQKWNFKSVQYERFLTFEELWTFMESCKETGTYENREVEGFVIRCKLKNEDYFFKYKFTEPYLLYRQFREVTKKLISDGMSIQAIIASVKQHRFITLNYLEFIEDLFKKNTTLKDQYLSGHGIIEVREKFLGHLNESHGMQLIGFDKFDDSLKKLTITKYKYILVSVATIGCGKTTVFQILSDLYGWPHIQNDNIGNKSGSKKLIELTLEALQSSDVVCFDRNNHQLRERKQIFYDMLKLKDNYLSSNVGFKYIALNFVPKSMSTDQLWDITFSRIVERGDNHQSIKSETDEKLSRSIMQGFIKRFQPLNIDKEPDSNFDLVIDLELGSDSSIKNAKLIVDLLKKHYPNLLRFLPTADEYDRSFQTSLEYKPTFTKTFNKKQKSEKKERSRQPSYIGIYVPNEIALKAAVAAGNNETWEALKNGNRLQQTFHATLSHVATSKGSAESLEKWQSLLAVLKIDNVKVHNLKLDSNRRVILDFYCDIKLNKIILAKDKLACIEVSLLKAYDSQNNELTFQPLNEHLHVTLGTVSPEIKPMESNHLLSDLFSGKYSQSEVDTISISDVTYKHLPIFAQF
ncbi:uncharacterized protein PRCAT00003334001 [Priceomyces carsonii]|uniref:uncharacterized protein n=1 Tax=Priceomyces carsonii TaxID=28549 RepID=UPI002EDB22BE|nr:unnamed protein product [Priceomyces carsonii]